MTFEEADALAAKEGRESLKKAFMRYMVEAWPSSYIYNVTDMVRADYGIFGKEMNGPNFLAYLELPHHPMNASFFFASYFPKTSRALFAKVDKNLCIRLAQSEKQTGGLVKSIRVEFSADIRRRKSTRFVNLRSLDRKNDWNTIK